MMEWRKHMNRITQMASQGLGRAEKSEVLSLTLLELERKLEDVKLVCQKSSTKLFECLQSNAGSDFEKRVRKLPLWALASTMVDSSSRLNPMFATLGKIVQMLGEGEDRLARELILYEIEVENKVLQPLRNIAERDVPAVQKFRKQLSSYVFDMDSAKNRYLRQPTKGSDDSLRDDFDEAKMKVEQAQDQFAAELYTFATREEEFCRLYQTLVEAQTEYHQRSLAVLEQMKPSFTREIDQHVNHPVFKTNLQTHLHHSEREIAYVIEDCIKVLDQQGLTEEGLFRIAGGKSRVSRLKAAFDANMADMEEYRHDIHCVCDVLKQYLRNLPEPLMTFELYEDWMSISQIPADGRVDAIKRTLEKLPKANYDNLRYLVKFLARIADHSDINKMSPSNLAIVIGPNLLWPREERGTNFQVASVSVELLISNANWFFPGTSQAGSGKPRGTAPGSRVQKSPAADRECRDGDFIPGNSRNLQSCNDEKSRGKPSDKKVDTIIPTLSSSSDNVSSWQARPLRFEQQPHHVGSPVRGLEGSRPAFQRHRRVASAGVAGTITGSQSVGFGDRSQPRGVEPFLPRGDAAQFSDEKNRSIGVSNIAIDYSGASDSSSANSSPSLARRKPLTATTLENQRGYSTNVPFTSPASQHVATEDTVKSNSSLFDVVVQSTHVALLSSPSHGLPDSDEQDPSSVDNSPKTTRRRRAPPPPPPGQIEPTSMPPPRPPPALATSSQVIPGHHRISSASAPITVALIERPSLPPPPAPPRPSSGKNIIQSANGAIISDEKNRTSTTSDVGHPSAPLETIGYVQKSLSVPADAEALIDDSRSVSVVDEKIAKTAELRAQWFQNGTFPRDRNQLAEARKDLPEAAENGLSAEVAPKQRSLDNITGAAENLMQFSTPPSVDSSRPPIESVETRLSGSHTSSSKASEACTTSDLKPVPPVPVARSRPPQVPPGSGMVTVTGEDARRSIKNPASEGSAATDLEAAPTSLVQDVPDIIQLLIKRTPPPVVPRVISRASVESEESGIGKVETHDEVETVIEEDTRL